MNATRGAHPRPDGTQRVEIGRMLATDETTEYLAVLIRKPLAEDELELLTWFLDTLAPGHGWQHQPREEAA